VPSRCKQRESRPAHRNASNSVGSCTSSKSVTERRTSADVNDAYKPASQMN